MSRHSLEIRDARPEDAPELLKLWAEAGSRSAEQPTPRPVSEAETALAQVAADPDERVVVGLYEGELVAAIHLRRAAMSPPTPAPVPTSTRADTPRHRHPALPRPRVSSARQAS